MIYQHIKSDIYDTKCMLQNRQTNTMSLLVQQGGDGELLETEFYTGRAREPACIQNNATSGQQRVVWPCGTRVFVVTMVSNSWGIPAGRAVCCILPSPPNHTRTHTHIHTHKHKHTHRLTPFLLWGPCPLTDSRGGGGGAEEMLQGSRGLHCFAVTHRGNMKPKPHLVHHGTLEEGYTLTLGCDEVVWTVGWSSLKVKLNECSHHWC